jgi:hypothetical protein
MFCLFLLIYLLTFHADQDGDYNRQGPKPTEQIPVAQTVAPQQTQAQQRHKHGQEGIQTAIIPFFYTIPVCLANKGYELAKKPRTEKGYHKKRGGDQVIF